MRYFFVSAFVLCGLFAAAQIQYQQKLYAYSEKKDSKTIHFIYLELAPNVAPIWDTAIIDGSIYAVHSSMVETLPLQLGERKKDKRMVVIRPQPDNKLWQLEFDLIEEKMPLKTGSIPDTTAFLLKATVQNRKVTYKVRQEVELVPRGSF